MILYDFLDVCETVRFDIVDEPYKHRVRNKKLSATVYAEQVIQEAINNIDSNDNTEIEKIIISNRYRLRNRIFELMLIDFLDVLDSNWKDKNIEIINISEHYNRKNEYRLVFPLNDDKNYHKDLIGAGDIIHFLPLLIPKLNHVNVLTDHFANYLLLTICLIRIDNHTYINEIMKESLKVILDNNTIDFDNTDIKELAVEIEFYTKDKFEVMCKIKKGIFEW